MNNTFYFLPICSWVDTILDPLGIGTSEFIGTVLAYIKKEMYQGIWDGLEKIFSWMFGIQQAKILEARNLITASPAGWNAGAFAFIRSVAENAAIPIAGCMITFVFCWQIISMVQESNQMHNIKPETMVLLMIKLGICLLVCAKSFEIVNGLFDLSAWAVSKIPLSPVSATDVKLDNLIPRDNPPYTVGKCFEILAYWFITLIAALLTYVLSIVIYVRVNIWYMELLIYASAAPIPFATFMNKEWGQVGSNYLRKMLAMSFEGFFMLVAFALYNAMCVNVLSASGGNSFLMSIVTTIGCGGGLIMLLNKTGSISASIFNAH